MSDPNPSSQSSLESAKEAAHHVEAEVEKVIPKPILRKIRKGIILVIGGTVLLIGIALLVLPGPAFLVVPAGLAILGLEFAWARRWLRKAREMFRDPKGVLRGKPSATSDATRHGTKEP